VEARRLASAALWVRIQASLKNQMGDISKEVSNTLARKKINKTIILTRKYPLLHNTHNTHRDIAI